MSGYKSSTKGELVAIYRLEFYKNQKKWKFCKNEKKIKKQVSSKQKLNETYCVLEQPVAEPPAPLDVAFLENDSDENLKESVKEALQPPRRRWATILDLKIDPDTDNEDWAIPDEKPVVRSCWGPAVEEVRSYEQECGEGDWGEGEGGDAWEGGRGWGDVEQVYSPELCVTNGHRSRLPVFAGWPAPNQHTAPLTDHNMLQNILQNAQRTGRQNVAETLKQHIESLGQNLEKNVEPNLTYMNQSMGRNVYQNTQQNLRPKSSHNFGQMEYNCEQSLKQMEQNVKQFGQTVGQIGQNVDNLGQNMEFLGQNMVFSGQNVKVDNTGQCKVENVIDLEQLEWEEGGVCVVEGGGFCEGEGGCVAGAVAAVAEAEGWLQGSMAHFYLEPAVCRPLSPCSLSSGDSAVFMRGAHARAHSSELELTAEDTCQCASMSANKLAHMSSAALRGALRSHAAAARRMLRELRLRATNNNTQPCPCPVSHDVTRSSVPTRDAPRDAPRDVPRDAPRDVTDPPGRGRGRRLQTK